MRSIIRVVFSTYALVCYGAFLVTVVYAMAWVGNFWSVFGLSGPWFLSMDVGRRASLGEALLVDLLLIATFGVQHSVMARQGFKRMWTRIVPPPIERSTYVLASSLLLALLFWQWRPLGAVLWDVSGSALGVVLLCASFVGWGILVVATFTIDHFELFGLRQALRALRDRSDPAYPFVTPGLYRAVRHPIYLGFLVAFWPTPVMTLGHLVFALGMTVYILIAVPLEERDLIAAYGDDYRAYRRRVPGLVPRVVHKRGDSMP
jgi:protein-S-isoprenylcysteine O-methyltransferase Ste14